MQSHNLSHGFNGEEIAASYLQSLGYKIIERNYRSGRWGELDIVCYEGDDLVFVEVKSRIGRKFGQPIEALTPGKLLRIRRTAEHYSLTHPQAAKSMRFDVVTVSQDKKGAPEVSLYRNVTR